MTELTDAEIHEASHAVVNHVLGGKCDGLMLVGGGGKCLVRERHMARTLSKWITFMVSAVAGHVGVCLAHSREPYIPDELDGWTDFTKLPSVLEPQLEDVRGLVLEFQMAALRVAWTILASNMGRVRRLAAALDEKGRLSGDEVLKFIEAPLESELADGAA